MAAASRDVLPGELVGYETVGERRLARFSVPRGDGTRGLVTVFDPPEGLPKGHHAALERAGPFFRLLEQP